MGVYGTTYYKAFNGLGKPSIKLEFEDNDELLAFQQRMQEGDGNDDPDGEMISSEEPVVWNEERQEFEPLDGYGDTYIVTDLRKRAKKEPGEVRSLTKFQFSKSKNAPELFEPVVSVSPSLFHVYPVYRGIKNGIVYFQKEFSDDYNADFILKDYVINKLEKLVTLNFARYKAYGTDGVSTVSVWSFSISCPICNITTAYGSKIEADFGLIEFTKELIAVLKNAQSKLRSNSNDYKTLQHQIERWQNAVKLHAWRENTSLGAPGDLYLVRDMRKRSRKEPGELVSNKNLRFITLQDGKIANFDKDLYYNTRSVFDQPKGYDYKSVKKEGDKYYITYKFFVPTAKIKDDPNTMAGHFAHVEMEADVTKIHNLKTSSSGRDLNMSQAEGKSDVYKSSYINNNYLYGYITNDYNKELQQKAFYVLFKQEFGNPNKTPYTKKLFLDFYANPTKYKMINRNGYGDHTLPEAWNEEYVGLKLNADGLGKTANDTLYNNNELMDCRGLKPTYKILDSYDAFFAPAQHAATFAGVGLSDTKKLIAEICRAHYKDCARIAQHLKGDTKLQSVFNLWHWLRRNIRYEYDREGREEVRTPLRTWADRRRGVDCDCLSVFAWCVLKCMGYDPAFELVSFNGKASPSHILVNLDGIRLDRVWFVFNALPPGVTGTEIYRLKTTKNGILAGLFN